MANILEQPKQRVLILGGTGYLGSHIVKNFVDSGDYIVRTTTTNLSDPTKMKGLKQILGNYEDLQRRGLIEFSQVDILNPRDVEQAAIGCSIIVHSASPTPIGLIKDAKEQEMLQNTILQGMKNVLQAVRSQGVKRLVLTSSTTCVIDKIKTKGIKNVVVTEANWADETTAESVYTRLKVRQEKMAWEEYRKGGFELVVLCPGNMTGPSLKREMYASAHAIKTLLQWSKIPGFGNPKVYGQFVDVRDVAKAHLHAVQKSNANGKRFIIVAQGFFAIEASTVLHRHFGRYYTISD